MLKNFDAIRDLIQNNTTLIFSEFISNYTDIFGELLPNSTTHAKHFSEFLSHNAFSVSYFKIMLHIFSEFISQNICTCRVTTK